ncbi:beta-lactamase [Corallococcus coralloides]|uniref:Beta-lactamase n=1 Tax=Corallococcus coralloides TaxID=184914 RepID=A0A410S095_CORCK|nr:beta-lactamase [Corallococcus coralloides]
MVEGPIALLHQHGPRLGSLTNDALSAVSPRQLLFKNGHNDSTANTLVCLPRGRRCVLILVRFVLGEAGVPWDWEYGDMAFWDGR